MSTSLVELRNKFVFISLLMK